MLPFLLCIYCTVLCAGRGSNEVLNHLHRARPREYQETLRVSVFSRLFLNLVEINLL